MSTLVANLDSDELADMQGDAATALPDTCTIRGYTSVNDGEGGETHTSSTIATNVPCRVKSKQPNAQQIEVLQGMGIRAALIYDVTLNANQSVSTKQQIIWRGRTLEVVSVGYNSWQIHLMVSCVDTGAA